MSEKTAQRYALTLELGFDKRNRPCVLEHLCNSAVSLYNCGLGECMKRWHTYERDPEFQALRKEYALAKKESKSLKPFHERFKACAQKHGYTLSQLEQFMNTVRKAHFPNFGSAECQALAKRAFSAVQKVQFGEAKKVRFHSKYEDMSFEGKSAGSKLHYDPKDGTIHYGESRFLLKIKQNDTYAMLCMMDEVAYVRVHRRSIRGRTRWYCQLILCGTPPSNQRHPTVYGNECGGIDPGVSTMALVTPNTARLYELAPECTENEAEIRRINRAMERSRRATNPQNYNPDGTVKSGRLKWNCSNRYLRLKAKRKELYRNMRIQREMSHHILAKEILRHASFLKTESMSYCGLAKRSGKTTRNKNNGKISSKKRYGRTVHARAPARLIAILNEKLRYKGRTVETVNTRTVRASQYNPLDGTYTKKDLRDRMIDLGNSVIVQRDLLSAYCILHTTVTNDSIDHRSAYDCFGTFQQLNDCEVERLRNEGQLRWYTA